MPPRTETRAETEPEQWPEICKGTLRRSEPGTLDTDYKTSSGTIRHGTKAGDRPSRSGKADAAEKLKRRPTQSRSKRPAAPMPEHWTNRTDSSRPYSELFQRSMQN